MKKHGLDDNQRSIHSRRRKRPKVEPKPVEHMEVVEEVDQFTSSIEQLLEHSVTKGERRLDSLARLLEVDGECAAVCFDGKRILISSNKLSSETKSEERNHIKRSIIEIMSYFAGVAHNRIDQKDRLRIFKNICVLYVTNQIKGISKQHFRHATGILAEYILSLEKPVDIREYKWNELMRIAGIKDTDPQSGMFLGCAIMAISRLATDFQKLEQDLNPIKTEVDTNIEKGLSEEIIQAFKNCNNYSEIRSDGSSNKKFPIDYKTVINKEGKREIEDIKDIEGQEFGFILLEFSNSSKHLHAEMQIAQRLVNQNTKGIKYIGISKLCCPECSCAIMALNNRALDKSVSDLQVIETVYDNKKDKSIDIDNKDKMLTLFIRGKHEILTSKPSKKSKWNPPYFINKKGNEDIRKSFRQFLKNFKESHTIEAKRHSSMLPSDSSSSPIRKLKNLKSTTILQTQSQITEIITNEPDMHVHENAFNQYKNIEYEYQINDILYIGRRLISEVNKEEERVKFLGVLGEGRDAEILSAQEYLTAYKNDLDSSTAIPVVGIFNPSKGDPNNGHWIGFCFLPQLNRKDNKMSLTVLYKDSLGEFQPGFEKIIKEIFGLENIKQISIIQSGKKEQIEDRLTSCGVFALKNINILAHTIANNLDQFIHGYDSYQFYNPNSDGSEYKKGILEQRREFAVVYAQAAYLEAHKTLENIKKAELGRTFLQSEADQIVALITNHNKFKQYRDIRVKSLQASESLPADESEQSRVITVEIATHGGDIDTYYYRIQFSRAFKNKKEMDLLKRIIVDALGIEEEELEYDENNRLFNLSPDNITSINKTKLSMQPTYNKEEFQKHFVSALNITTLPDKELASMLANRQIVVFSYDDVKSGIRRAIDHSEYLLNDIQMFLKYCAQETQPQIQLQRLIRLISSNQNIFKEVLLPGEVSLFEVLAETKGDKIEIKKLALENFLGVVNEVIADITNEKTSSTIPGEGSARLDIEHSGDEADIEPVNSPVGTPRIKNWGKDIQSSKNSPTNTSKGLD